LFYFDNPLCFCENIRVRRNYSTNSDPEDQFQAEGYERVTRRFSRLTGQTPVKKFSAVVVVVWTNSTGGGGNSRPYKKTDNRS
jgi:hypothetical protein